LEKRVAIISTTDLVIWTENALFTIGKQTTGWLKSKDVFLLDEAELGAEALLAIIKELKKRANEL
jgi:hypothetical protein